MLCTLKQMSLFDAVEVKPPRPCSRCNTVVIATSLFCPQCGQSMVSPLPVVATRYEEKVEVESAAVETPPEPEARTTGWLRRSLSLGKKPAAPETDPVVAATQDTQVMSLFDIEQAEAVSGEKAPCRPPPEVRFLLKFSNGLSVTVGNNAGVIGVRPVVDGDEIFRVCVEDETDTVAPEHCEFGVDKGVFWVHDLKTVSGTVVEEPGAPALQCIPYERYSLVRGSRVGMGDLSFTLH